MTQFDDQRADEPDLTDDTAGDSSDAFIGDPEAAEAATRERMRAQAEAEREAGHPVSSDPTEDLSGPPGSPLAGDPNVPDTSPGFVPAPDNPAPVPDVAPVPGVEPQQPLPGRDPGVRPSDPGVSPTEPGAPGPAGSPDSVPADPTFSDSPAAWSDQAGPGPAGNAQTG